MNEKESKLKQLRGAIGFTQAELAELFGITTPTVHAWENDEPNMSKENFEMLNKIGVNAMFPVIDEVTNMTHPGVDINNVRMNARQLLKEVRERKSTC